MSGHVNKRVSVKRKLEVKISRAICAVDFKRLYIFDRETGCDFFSVENAVSRQSLCAFTISNCDFQKLHRKNDCNGSLFYR